MSTLAGRLLDRAVDVLDRLDFSPAALRADLADAECRHAGSYTRRSS